MKTYWSAFLFLSLLLVLAGCSQEQFGTVPQTKSSQVNPVQSFESSSCSAFTLIKPKVDILYVVDNSTSTYYVANDIKNAIRGTVDSISQQFDYRAIGTPLLETASGNSNFQVLTNSSDLSGIPSDARRIQSTSDFSFFTNTVSGQEKGLERIYSFINAHISDGLFRQNAYLLVVLISNGRDSEIEKQSIYSNAPVFDQAAYNTRKTSLLNLKTALNSQQFRIMSVTAHSDCISGYASSMKSYVAMSKDLYLLSGANDQAGATYPDSYNLCQGNISSIFTTVNSAIQQVVQPHTYRYWPITFAENNETVSIDEIKVFKISGSSRVEMPRTSTWTYYKNTTGSPINSRILPSVGEPINGTHFVQFTAGNYITYPDCVSIQSVSRTEYFGYVVLHQKPQVNTIIVKVNDVQIPSSAWTYMGNSSITQNIKVPYPNVGDENPPVIKSGFMIKITNPSYYYRSGDRVDVYYLPAGI